MDLTSGRERIDEHPTTSENPVSGSGGPHDSAFTGTAPFAQLTGMSDLQPTVTHDNDESNARETFRQQKAGHTGQSFVSGHNYHSDDGGSSHLSRSYGQNTTGKIGSLHGFGKAGGRHHNTTDQIRKNAESLRNLKGRLNQQRMRDFASRLVVDE